jgi:hypothetical protein
MTRHWKALEEQFLKTGIFQKTGKLLFFMPKIIKVKEQTLNPLMCKHYLFASVTHIHT